MNYYGDEKEKKMKLKKKNNIKAIIEDSGNSKNEIKVFANSKSNVKSAVKAEAEQEQEQEQEIDF